MLGLNYERAVDGSNVLLIPGLSGSVRQFDEMVSVLGSLGVGVIVSEGTMFGKEIWGYPPSVAQVARAVEEQMTDVALPYLIVTHSVGVFVGAAVLRREPRNCVGMVSFNCGLSRIGAFIASPGRGFMEAPGACIHAIRLILLLSLPLPPSVKLWASRNEAISRLLLGSLIGVDSLDRQQRRALLVEAGNGDIKKALWRNRKHWEDFRASRVSDGFPAILVVGSLDPLGGGEDVGEVAESFADAEVVVLDDVGHAIPVEDPGSATAIVLRALGFHEPGV